MITISDAASCVYGALELCRRNGALSVSRELLDGWIGWWSWGSGFMLLELVGWFELEDIDRSIN